MRNRKFKKLAAGTLAAMMCLTAATTFAASADNTPPSGQPGGTPPSGTVSGQQGGTPPSGGGGGADTMTYDYTGTLSGALTADGAAKTSDSEAYSATAADQNAALAENAGTLTVTKGTFTKSGDDTNGDNCNFYGINSIILAAGRRDQGLHLRQLALRLQPGLQRHIRHGQRPWCTQTATP
jgi:hypothetical protein